MPAKHRPKGSVLIVDDEELIRQTLAEFLEEQGFRVETLPDGESARERIAESRFDVLVCDVSLPGIDGLDVLAHVREVSPETVVFLITAYATVEIAVEAFRRGAHDYFMKPILLEEVANKIRRALGAKSVELADEAGGEKPREPEFGGPAPEHDQRAADDQELNVEPARRVAPRREPEHLGHRRTDRTPRRDQEERPHDSREQDRREERAAAGVDERREPQADQVTHGRRK